MTTSRIVAMLRVKNEDRWIEAVIESLSSLCYQVVVFDDHSTDNTVALCARAGAEVISSPYEGLDETRDKNHLLKRALLTVPDWILNIDGDEVLEPHCTGRLVEAINGTNPAAAYSLRVRYLWDQLDRVRVDGVYGDFRSLCLFRAADPDNLRYLPTGMPGNLHCARVPLGVRGYRGALLVDLLHLGYLYRADRLTKYERYTRIDPNNELEDRYRHIVQGDVPEVPASARLKHAGPMRFEAIPASKGIAQLLHS